VDVEVVVHASYPAIEAGRVASCFDGYLRDVLETSARLLRLLSLLQSRRDWTGPQLAERLGVTPRTVRNDIRRLRQLGYAIDTSLGVTGGYRLGTGANIPPLLLDDDEAIAVTVGLRAATGGSIAGIEEASVRALGKIEQLLPPASRRRLAALAAMSVSPAPRTPAPDVRADVLAAIASACRDQTCIRIEYQRNDETSSRRDIEPYRLVHTRHRWYLLAWDLGRGDWRTFRMDRLSLPKNHAGPRFVPRPLPQDDPAAFVVAGIAQARWPYTVRVVVRADAARTIGLLPEHTVVEPVDEGTCHVELGADSPVTMAAWLGILDADFSIESPGDHTELLEHLRRTAARYQLAAQRIGIGDPIPDQAQP
jgi:predicted DNA-binding transcriptional regulator YafY